MTSDALRLLGHFSFAEPEFSTGGVARPMGGGL